MSHMEEEFETLVVPEDEELDDDEVVSEVPVFLSTPATLPYVLQFPLWPKTSPNREPPEEHVTGVRWREGQDAVEMDVAVPQAREHFDKESVYNTVKRVTLASARVPAQTHYMVGVMVNNELHMMDVRAVLQMRPKLSHVDELTRSERDDVADAVDELVPAAELADAMVPIQVKVKRRESDRQVAAREKSHAFLKKKEEEEQWVHVEPSGTSACADQLLAMRKDAISASLSKGDYFLKLNPDPVRRDTTVKQSQQASADHLSRGELAQMSGPDQVRAVLRHAVVQTYDKVRTYASKATESELIQTLEEVGHLVQGCWVLNSELVPGATDLMIKARDHVLAHFNGSRVIQRRTALEPFKLNSDIARELLAPLGMLKPRAGWEWCRPTDEDFIENFPQVVERQNAYWGRRKDELTKWLNEHSSTSVSRVHKTPIPQTPEGQLTKCIARLIVRHGVLTAAAAYRLVCEQVENPTGENRRLLSVLEIGDEPNQISPDYVKIVMDMHFRAVELPGDRETIYVAVGVDDEDERDYILGMLIAALETGAGLRKQEVRDAYQKDKDVKMVTLRWTRFSKQLAVNTREGWKLKDGSGVAPDE